VAQSVGLGCAGHAPAPALTGVFEGVPDDPFDARAREQRRLGGDLDVAAPVHAAADS